MADALSQMKRVKSFVDLLRSLPEMDQVFNPWRDYDEVNDAGPDAPSIRADNLTRYLSQRTKSARLLLIAEAAGYRGCKFTGIAMTSERILLGHLPAVSPDRVFAADKRATSRLAKGFSEPTASIVWPHLCTLLPAQEFVLWNAFPCHPHRPGEPLSNRQPNRSELDRTAHLLEEFTRLFPVCKQIIAVGNVAEGALNEQWPRVRHPAFGGAVKFRTQIQDLIAKSSHSIISQAMTLAE